LKHAETDMSLLW